MCQGTICCLREKLSSLNRLECSVFAGGNGLGLLGERPWGVLKASRKKVSSVSSHAACGEKRAACIDGKPPADGLASQKHTKSHGVAAGQRQLDQPALSEQFDAR